MLQKELCVAGQSVVSVVFVFQQLNVPESKCVSGMDLVIWLCMLPEVKVLDQTATLR